MSIDSWVDLYLFISRIWLLPKGNSWTIPKYFQWPPYFLVFCTVYFMIADIKCLLEVLKDPDTEFAFIHGIADKVNNHI